MRGDADVAVTLDEDERDPLVPGDLLRCLTNEVQRRAKRVRCNAGLGSAALTADPCAFDRPMRPDPSHGRASLARRYERHDLEVP